ncbi:hypothetical protein KZZ52_21570 [Dactylosporangium sp. AC04546]|uniref:hypothetical protein n=1 Tax=Dactylosporangium sp. AC04546 TaxID=2862460 RepID=UPI001EDD0F7E|nr:hypothetical protein [Dactylosporangium sp. AC04546]WVK87871.1 hypothetical protein KZZ52_21570 [Dactylosporangium sp. AC04546]
MSNRDEHGVPRVDEAIDLATVRDEAEDIAVPAFDYISEPIDAVIEGVLGHSHDRVPDTQVHADERAADERQHHEVGP